MKSCLALSTWGVAGAELGVDLEEGTLVVGLDVLEDFELFLGDSVEDEGVLGVLDDADLFEARADDHLGGLLAELAADVDDLFACFLVDDGLGCPVLGADLVCGDLVDLVEEAEDGFGGGDGLVEAAEEGCSGELVDWSIRIAGTSFLVTSISIHDPRSGMTRASGGAIALGADDGEIDAR